VDTVRDHDDDEVMMWLVFVSFFFFRMGWDGMKWAGLGEMVFAITYFTTATNLTLLYSFAFAFVCFIPMENGGEGCRCCFCFLFAALVFWL
jgi:hypothetical protein